MIPLCLSQMNLETQPAKFTWFEKVQIKPVGPCCAFQSFHLVFLLQQPFQPQQSEGLRQKNPKENASVPAATWHEARPAHRHTHASSWPLVRNTRGPTVASTDLQTFVPGP